MFTTVLSVTMGILTLAVVLLILIVKASQTRVYCFFGEELASSLLLIQVLCLIKFTGGSLLTWYYSSRACLFTYYTAVKFTNLERSGRLFSTVFVRHTTILPSPHTGEPAHSRSTVAQHTENRPRVPDHTLRFTLNNHVFYAVDSRARKLLGKGRITQLPKLVSNTHPVEVAADVLGKKL